MLNKLRVWLWCLMHLPRIFNLAQNAAVRSADIDHIRSISQAVRDDLDRLIQEQRERGSKEVDLLEFERREIADLILNFSRLQKDELAAIKRELLFLQRRSRSRQTEQQSKCHESDSADSALSELAALSLDVQLATEDSDQINADDWLQRFSLSDVIDSDHPLAHLDCGSGWFLKKAEDAGLPAYGTLPSDLARKFYSHSSSDIKIVDLKTHLSSLADGSLGGLLITRALERLSFPELVDALDDMHRVLSDRAVLIIKCANPENLQVGARARLDPCRTQLLHPNILSFLVSQRGFDSVEVVRQNPVGWEQWLDRKDENSVKLNALLFGPQDYCIIARRA